MLRFKWEPQHAGAPDAPGYDDATDVLADGDSRELMKVPTGESGMPAPTAALQQHVADWLNARGHGRLVVLCHGYSFDPADPDDPTFDDDPYHGVYDPQAEGNWIDIVGDSNAVCFAWNSAPGMADAANACWTNPYEYAVYDIAPRAARALAAVIDLLLGAGVTVDLFAHSLGTRTALKALPLLDKTKAVRRAVLLGGAEYSVDALSATRTLSTDFFNFVTKGDAVLKWGASELGGALRPPRTVVSRVIGRDGMQPAKNWIDLQLDHSSDEIREEFDDWFRKRGYRLSGEPTASRGQHWAYYLHPGNRRLQADVLAQDELSVAWFLGNGVPYGVERFRYGLLKNKRPPKTPRTCKQRRALYK